MLRRLRIGEMPLVRGAPLSALGKRLERLPNLSDSQRVGCARLPERDPGNHNNLVTARREALRNRSLGGFGNCLCH